MQHDCTCGHCGSPVPTRSTVCLSCGATWRSGTAGNAHCLVGLGIAGAGILALFDVPGPVIYPITMIAMGIGWTWMGTLLNRPAWYR